MLLTPWGIDKPQLTMLTSEFDSLGDTSTLADPGVVGDLIDNRKDV